MDDHSYFYLGYVLQGDKDADRFAKFYTQSESPILPDNLDVTFSEMVTVGPGSRRGRTPRDTQVVRSSTSTIYHIREGIERFFITDINNPAASALTQSRIPVIVERPGHHEPDGGHVLYMDGHVEYLKYPGKWPRSKGRWDLKRSLNPTWRTRS